MQQGIVPSSAGKRRVAVIGAGVSGLADAKCLLDEGLEPVVYEQAAHIGGLWNYDETLPDGGGVMYRSLRTNTSKQTLAFSDFPLPQTAPDYPHRSEVLQYLRDYAAHFRLHRLIRLNTVVESVEPAAQDRWTVRARRGAEVTTETFDAVVVGSGRDHFPQLPQLPGADTFAGQLLHSSRYKGPEAFAESRVVVAGVGSSGVDIATELSSVAEQVCLSSESGAWFIPLFILNRPYDHHLTRLAQRLPYRLRMALFQRLLLLEYRRMGVTLRQLRAQGLPLPRFDLWSARLTPCNDLLPRIQRGAIEVKLRMVQLKGHEVRFADGSVVEADAIVCCTGYTLRFPFLPEGLVHVKENRVDLYKHVFHPDLPTLAFVGLCTVAGSHLPVAEMQGRLVARMLAGRMSLPSQEEMHVAIEQYRAHPSSQSPVPMQVQLLEYVEDLAAMLGVRPRIFRHPSAAPRWFLGPFEASHYRLDEPQQSQGGTLEGSTGQSRFGIERDRFFLYIDRLLRKAIGRICGEDGSITGGFHPFVSEAPVLYIPCTSEAAYHRRYQEPDKLLPGGSEIEWPIPYWRMDIGCAVMILLLAAVNEGLGAGYAGFSPEGLEQTAHTAQHSR